MKMKLMKIKIYLQQKLSRKGTCSPNYSRFHIKGQQELSPFYMLIPYGNAFCTVSSQVMQVKNQFLCFSYHKTSLKFCASLRFFLAVFMAKFQKKKHYLNYVTREIVGRNGCNSTWHFNCFFKFY